MAEAPLDKAPVGRAGQFRSGFWRGIVASSVGLLILLYLGSMSGLLLVTVERYPDLVDMWFWAYENLRSSMVPFAAVLVWFAATLMHLRRELSGWDASHELVYRLDKRIDVLIGLFFGIGVIWTAIGMRSALVGALGGLDAEAAARLGAFGVLQAMVDEGILLALSTTIVGGIGGYLLRLVKMISIGAALDQFYSRLNRHSAQQVLQRLQAIEQAVLDLTPPAAEQTK